MSRETLRSAFIDAQCDMINECKYSFSDYFKQKMDFLIRQQKGAMRFVNSVGKRAACVILAVLICLTSTVFGVKAIREPVFKAVENFYVSIKEKLSGTRAKNIAEYFTDDITQIVATNYITSVPKQYIIDDRDKIAAFAKLMSETYWVEPQNDFYKPGVLEYSFEFRSPGGLIATLNLSGNVAEIISGNRSYIYCIRERTYLDILAFTTQRYYLHRSELEKPEAKLCLNWQQKALAGLSEAQKEEVCKTFRNLHNHIEMFLLGSVSSLKEPDSVYWEKFELERDEVYTDPFTGTQVIDNGYYIITDMFDTLIFAIKDVDTKTAVSVMKQDYINAIKKHDIGSVFTVHEFIHDYDYYAVNYPVQYDLDPPDWGGIKIYFGRIS